MSKKPNDDEDVQEVERLLSELTNEPGAEGKALKALAHLARISVRHEAVIEKQTNSLIRLGKITSLGTVSLAIATFVLAYITYLR
ncbi:MAG TPA: hypothetical protein VIH03_08015 [Nitrososphaerales archaeon]